MNAHKFVAEHGIDEAKRVLSEAKQNSKIYDLSSKKYHESKIITIPMDYSMHPTYRAVEVKEFIVLSELKQVVESFENIEFYGGFESVKFKIKRAEFNGWLCISTPHEDGFAEWYVENAKKAIADYELVESYKQEKCEVLDMVDVSPHCEVINETH